VRVSSVITGREAQEIMTTTDESLIRKLHAMRAARSILEHEGNRWVITRIVSRSDGARAELEWSVYGTRARWT
jgi:hypothetical protein